MVASEYQSLRMYFASGYEARQQSKSVRSQSTYAHAAHKRKLPEHPVMFWQL
jgi:hypothetical protein